jgi:putative endonuclease
MEIFLYILQCSDGSYYTSVTSDLVRRVSSHIEGSNPKSYTFLRRPVKLVYYEKHQNRQIAFEREAIIKKWSRKKKSELIQKVEV